MEIKILQVFYDKNGLPYKDKERAVHYPITSGTFLGASNTTQIRFYYDQLDELNESTFVAVSKLPNGRIGSEILESEYDSELQENYAVLNLSQFYTQYKGDVYISLQGYEGGVRVEQDENGIYSILGTPTIQATGSIRMYVAYAPTFIGSGQTENVTLQRILAELSTKLGIRQETLHVEELPSVGNPNIWYVVNDDPNDTTKANIYIWNAKTQTYVWVGDNTLNLGDYYTQEQGEQFEQDVRETIGNGSPKGVYATLSDLESAYPTGTTGIYVVSADGHWYYWNTENEEWTDGGDYLSTADAASKLWARENGVSGKVSGDYDYLSGLQTSIPSGNDNTYLVRNTGHWYYWNGNAWTDGGVYTETYDELKYEIARNDFDISKFTDQAYISSSQIAENSAPWWNNANGRMSKTYTFVKAGEKIKYKLRGPSGYLLIAIYSAQFTPGNLIQYVQGTGTGGGNENEGTLTVLNDGFMSACCFWSHDEDDYIYIENAETRMIENNKIKIDENSNSINAINYSKSDEPATLEMIARLGFNVYSPDTPPEQSISSYKLAYKNGFRILLADVRRTKDNKFVCWHDDNIAEGNKVKNADGTDIVGDVYISNTTLQDLIDNYDFGVYKGQQYAGTKILQLDDFLITCKRLNALPHIEIKQSNPTYLRYWNAEDIKNLCDVFKKYSFSNNIMVQSEVASQVSNVVLNIPNAIIGIGAANEDKLEELENTLGNKKNRFVYIDISGLTSSIINLCVNYGYDIGITEITTIAEINNLISNKNLFTCRYVATRIPLFSYLKNF